jgi:glutaredoxin
MTRTTALAVMVLLLAFGSAASAATVYKWRDAEGRLHITSEQPPAGAQIELTLPSTPAPAPRAEPSPGPGATRSAAPESPRVEVVMYATKRCPYCRKARQYFTDRGVTWREVDIEASSAADREFKARGGQGVPLIFINDARVSGWSPEHVGALLDRALARR